MLVKIKSGIVKNSQVFDRVSVFNDSQSLYSKTSMFIFLVKEIILVLLMLCFMKLTVQGSVILDLIILITFHEEHKLWSSSLCNFLHPHTTSSFKGPNILLSILFSNILNLCSSPNVINVRGQVSHPYKTTSKITVLYILICTFLDSRWEEKLF
jgi:hypothetical protein